MSELTLRLQVPRNNAFKLQLDCTVPARGCTAIYGPSGSGKTTLLNCIAGLQPIGRDGLVRFGDSTWVDDSVDLPAHQRAAGYVFQNARLFPWLDVAGNLEYALRRRYTDRGPGLEQVCEWLQLGPLLSQKPAQLSAGQQQRVAIGRALLSAPRLLLLDEPLANIDQSSRRKILDHLQQIQREAALPMIYVSHDIEEVTRLADWLVILEQGQVSASGPTLELCSQLELGLAHEEQAAALIQASVSDRDEPFNLTRLNFAGQDLWVTGVPAPLGTTMRLRIPARDVSLCLEQPQQTSIQNVLTATIAAIEESVSDRLLVRLQVGDQYLLARLTRKSVVNLGLQPGQAVYAQIKSVALLSDGPH